MLCLPLYYCVVSRLLLLLFCVSAASCSLINISPPMGYSEGDDVPIVVNSLTSNKTVVPYEYYAMKTCMPDEKRIREETGEENLGEVLLGNRIMPSLYYVSVLQNVTCQPLCIVTQTERDKKVLDNLITDNYRGNMFLAGLPLVERMKKGPTSKMHIGYQLGNVELKRAAGETITRRLINNHLHFTVSYATLPNRGYMITGFYAKPHSLNSPTGCPPDGATVEEWPEPATTRLTHVAYSYSVSWEPDNSGAVFVTRWDVYSRLGSTERKKAHLVALLNSMILLSLLGVIVMGLLLRIVRRDLVGSGEHIVGGADIEEPRWKLVRGDVFRTPSNALILTGLVSTGCQMMSMFVLTLLFSVVGVTQLWHTGSLLTNFILFFCCSSCVSGFVAGRMLVSFHMKSWKNGLTAVTMVPLAMLGTYLIGNTINWSKQASTAVSLRVLFIIIFLWIAVPVPLSFCGLSAGFRAGAFELPTKLSSIPRAIPSQSIRKRWLLILMGGAVSFCAAFMEIVCVLGSFWKGQPFLYMGYLFGVTLIIAAVCAEVAVVVTFAMLCEEDYQWWWGSFCTSGSCGVYYFCYSLAYLFGSLEIRQPLSVLLFLVYTFEISLVIMVILGTMGFIASAAFVRVTYSAIKSN
uniref:Transmembrane 9 superfamily member n=1 Tax=Trypanosoma congolense (strain IL3000) TaxID=1068625 RepID=G0UKT2_TRYCI|nr:putative endosomal integral membrane protein [Trypanosoma congolense IL3000]